MQLGNYELDDIYCGDSAVMLAGLPDGCIDLTCTSPPYDNFDGAITHGNGLRKYNGYSWDFTAIARQLYRVTKPGGVVVWVVGDATVNGSETGSSFRQALGFMEIGFNLHDTMIYEQTGTGAKGSNLSYWQTWEYMFVFSKSQPKSVSLIADKKNIHAGTVTRGERLRVTGDKKAAALRLVPEWSNRTNIWRVTPDRTDCHPAPFPEALARDHIISWSNPGDIILDPFAGSGTTAKMSKVLSRHWLGFDISQEYVTLAKKRVEYAPTPLPLFVESGQPKAEQTSMF